MGNIISAVQVQSRLRLCLEALEKRGKTFTSLAIATGMIRRLEEKGGIARNGKICVVDSEQMSSTKYAKRIQDDRNNKFMFDLYPLKDYSPEGYIAAFREVDQANYEIMIADQISHEWNAIMEDHAKQTLEKGSQYSFPLWGPIKLRHRAFLEGYLKSRCHVIACMRLKSKHRMDKATKEVVKLGTRPIQQEETPYEFDGVGRLEIDQATNQHILKIGPTRFEEISHKVFVNPGQELGAILADLMMDGESALAAPMPELDAELVKTIHKYLDILDISDDDFQAATLSMRGVARIEDLSEHAAREIINGMRSEAAAQDRLKKQQSKRASVQTSAASSEPPSGSEADTISSGPNTPPSPSSPVAAQPPPLPKNMQPQVLTPDQMKDELFGSDDEPPSPLRYATREGRIAAIKENREASIEYAKDLAEGLGYGADEWYTHADFAAKSSDVADATIEDFELMIAQLLDLTAKKNQDPENWDLEHALLVMFGLTHNTKEDSEPEPSISPGPARPTKKSIAEKAKAASPKKSATTKKR